MLIGPFSHFNTDGLPKMVDISHKTPTKRRAIAHSSILLNETIYQSIQDGKNKKGDVLAVAQVAGIMAAKNTANIIPMCHPIMISSVDIQFDWQMNVEEKTYELMIQTEVITTGQTGVEMEALVAASATALTIYDMCKAISKQLVIGPTSLMSKTGGKGGPYYRHT